MGRGERGKKEGVGRGWRNRYLGSIDGGSEGVDVLCGNLSRETDDCGADDGFDLHDCGMLSFSKYTKKGSDSLDVFS